MAYFVALSEAMMCCWQQKNAIEKLHLEAMPVKFLTRRNRPHVGTGRGLFLQKKSSTKKSSRQFHFPLYSKFQSPQFCQSS